MKALMILALLFGLTGCRCMLAPSTTSGNTLSIVIKNESGQPFHGTIGAGALSRTIDLEPNTQRGFWAYKSMIPDTIVLIISEKKK